VMSGGAATADAGGALTLVEINAGAKKWGK
jgi:hypothetical protein